MRKSFTRLLGLIVLFSTLSLSFALAQPKITALDPVDLAAGVSYEKGESFKMTFSEPVVVASGTGVVGLYDAASGVQIEAISVTNPLPSSISISGNDVSVNFAFDVVELKQYYVTVTQDAFKSAATGIYFPGITYTGTVAVNGVLGPWNFTVGDYTPPTLTNLIPKGDDEAKAGDLTPTLSLQFTDNGPAMTNGAGSVYLYEVMENGEGAYVGTTAASAFTGVGVSKTLTYTVPAPLKELTEYYVRVDDNAFQDVSTHNLYYGGINNSTEWKFRTADVTPPTAVAAVGDATDVYKNEKVVVTFSDNRTAKGYAFALSNAAGSALANNANVAGGFTVTPAIAFTAKYVGDNKVEIYPPATGWVSNTSYQVDLNGAFFGDNEANTAVAAANIITFKAGDFDEAAIAVNTAAAAGTTVAPNNTTDQKNTTNIYLNVNAVDALSGNPVDLYYYVVKTGATAPKAADVVAVNKKLPSLVTGGVTDPNIHEGWVAVDKNGAALENATAYDIYFATVDKATTPNTSTDAATLASIVTVTTNDILAPVVEKVDMTNKGGSTVNIKAAAGTNIDKASNIVITFDENVAFTANSDFELKWADGSANGVTLAAGVDYAVGVAANVVTITPAHGFADYAASAWKNSGAYTLTIKDKKVSDLGNPNVPAGSANEMAQQVYTFTVEDYTGPVPTFASNDLQTLANVATDANIVIDFGEPVKRANGAVADAANVFFRDAASTLVPATITWDAAGQVVTIDPTNSLTDNAALYSIEFTSSLVDAANNTLGWYEGATAAISAGVLGVETATTGFVYFLEFTTADETAPAVSFVNPINGQTVTKTYNGLDINVTFNEVVYDAAGNAINVADENIMRSLISVKKVSDNSMIEFDVTAGAAQAFTIDLSRFITAYEANESYTVSLNGLFDAAGNAITNTSMTYTVQEYDSPILTNHTPTGLNVTAGTPIVLKLTYNENVVAVAGKNIIITATGTAPFTETIDVSTAAVTIAGNVVTVTSANNVASLDNYVVTLDAGAFTDTKADPNPADGISSTTFWTFKGADNVAPVIASTVPADGTTVGIPANMTINFTEASGKIVAGPGKVYVREVGNTGIPDYTFIAQDVNAVTIAGTTATLNFDPSNFNYGGNYWVEIEANAFKDEAGNFFAGWVGNTGNWDFSIGADPLPNYDVVASTPADDANNVGLTQAIKLKFTEPVWVNSPVGKFLTIRNADATAHTTVDFGGGVVNYSWNAAHDEITVIHSNPFLANSNYYVTVTTGTFEDASGQAIAAINDLDLPGDYNFTTQDLTAPVVSAATVGGINVLTAAASTGINKDGNIEISFSEPVVIATPNAAVTLNGLGGAIPFAATFSASTNVLTVNPTAALASEDLVTLDIVGGQIADKATYVGGPNYVAAGNVVTFTVQDYIRPQWTAAPAGVSGNNQITVNTIATNEATTIYYLIVKDGVTVTQTAAYIKANATASVANTAVPFDIKNLDGDQVYDIYFIAEDAAGNLMDHTKASENVESILNIATLDNIKPEMTSFNPKGSCVKNQAAGGTDLVIEFSENVSLTAAATAAAAGLPGVMADYIWVRNAATDVAVPINSITSNVYVPAAGAVPAKPANITINIAAGVLAEKASYYVEIDPGVFEDNNVDGNAAAPFTANVCDGYFWGKTAWTFTTADETAPAVDLTAAGKALGNYTPYVGAVLDANNEDLIMVFDEPVSKGAGMIYIYRMGDAAAQEIINVTSTDVSIAADEKTVTIVTRADYSDGVEYYVLMPTAGTFVDKSCDPVDYAGITLQAGSFAAATNATEIWWFVGQDEIAPSVVSGLPTGTNENVATNVTVEFSELVYKTGTAGVGAPIDLAWAQANVVMKDAAGTAVTFSALTNNTVAKTTPYAHNVTQLVLTPSAALKSETTYTVTVTGAKFEDGAEQTIATDYVWSFTTGDYAAPYILAWSPEKKAPIVTGQANNQVVTLTFDEPVILNNNVQLTDTNVDALISFVRNVGAVPVTFDATINATKDVITITPTQTLDTYYIYDVTLLAAANPLKELEDYGVVTAKVLNTNQTMQFQVGDYKNPVWASWTPASGSFNANTVNPIEIGVATTDVNGVLTPEKMAAGTGNVNIYRSNGTVFDVVAAADCDFTTAGTIKIPHTEFEPYTSYYVMYATGVFTDEAGNPLAGTTAITDWTFSTSDNRQPEVVEFITPATGTTDATVKSDLVFRFSENVSLLDGTKTIVIYDKTDNPTDDGNIVEVITAANAALSGSNPVNGFTTDVVTFNPVNDFTAGKSYYVKLIPGAFQDVNTLPSDGILSYDDWYFTVGDAAAPKAISAVPSLTTKETVEHGTPEFALTFDMNIALGNGKIKLYQYFETPIKPENINSLLIDEIDATADMVSGNTLTFTFDANIKDAIADYYILLEPGTVTSTNANAVAWAGFTSPINWTFATDADVTAPAFVEATTNIAEDVMPDAVVATLVLEDFNGISPTFNGNFQLIEVGGDTVAIDNSRINVSSTPDANGFYTDSDTITITFVDELKEEADYYIQVADGVVTDNSNSKVAFAGITDDSWAFSVNDFTAPVATFTMNGSTNTVADELAIEIEYSENVQVGAAPELRIVDVATDVVAATVTITEENITDNVVSVLVSGLSDMNIYYVAYDSSFVNDLTYGAYTDVRATAAVADNTWFITTGDNTAPELVSFEPSSIVNVDSTVVELTFSEKVVAAAAGTVTISSDDEAADRVIDVADFTVENDSTYTVVVKGLVSEATYTVVVNEGAFEDLSANANGNLEVSNSFDVADIIAPTAVFYPATPVADYKDVELTIEFNDAVAAATGNVVIYDAATDAVVATIAAADFATSNDSVFTYTTNDLYFGTFYVLIDAGAFVDATAAPVASDYAGVTETTTWVIEVVDSVFDPCYTIISPVDGTVDVATTTELVIEFCAERIKPGNNAKITVSRQSNMSQDFIDFVITSDMISADMMTLTVPVTGLDEKTTYSVTLAPGAIVDEAGNAFSGIIDANTWNFTTIDATAPVVTVTAGTVSNLDGEATMTRDEAGIVYLVHADVPATKAAITAAIADDKAVAGVVETAGGSVVVSVEGLVAGNYRAVAIDEAGNVGESTEVLIVEDYVAPAPVVSVDAATVNNVDGEVEITVDMAGVVYLVNVNVAATADAIAAAITSGNAVAGVVATANGSVTVSAAGLVAGEYRAVAFNDAGLAGESTNKVTVEDVVVVLRTIAEVQGTGDATPFADQVVTVQGVVTGIDRNGNGFFMQDAMSARSGIYVFDKNVAAEVSIGTSIQLTATAVEYYTLTQLKNVTEYEFVSKVATITPMEISAADVANEDYEGVYVKVDSLKATEAATYGEWFSVAMDETSVKLDEQLFEIGDMMSEGQRYNFKGIVNYTFEEYKLAPTSASDIDYVLSTIDLSVAIDIYPNPFDNYIQVSTSSEVELTKAVITNIAGQLVKEVMNPENKITTSELRSGVYFISLHTEDGVAKTQRIIKR
ncbi:Ig-like domain-containing protein [Roseimarinus sediminis]|uniref:Ig-like domain-containing protein n=1 Tax=Roseimarinus sediminis TaxID=1610899 RepID=UPI003D1FD738